MRVFRSKIDLWLLLILLYATFVCLYASYTSVRDEDWLTASALLILGVGLPGWLLLSTRYLVSGGQLIVRCGPFSTRIGLASITHVEATYNPLSSPALSLDRLAIYYNNGSRILVSPRDKEGFRSAIGQ